MKGKLSAVEIFIKPNFRVEKIQDEIQNILGKNYVVKNKYQQEEMLFKVMQSEKIAIYAILTFILILAMFNIVGTLAMLILDKKEDVLILFQLACYKSHGTVYFYVGGVFIKYCRRNYRINFRSCNLFNSTNLGNR